MQPAVFSKSKLQLPQGHPSPASRSSNRVAVQGVDSSNACHAFVASGSTVFHAVSTISGASGSSGKGGLVMPTNVKPGVVEPLINIPHRAEVQSLTLEARAEGRSVLGSIDSYGRAIVAEVSAVDAGPITVKAQYELTPPVNEGSSSEGGWACLAFSPTDLSMVAAARSFPRCVDIYDSGMHVRTLH
eukprot:CAMPEP_0198219104 /NCGR_PEP_ID=MMETSP1445-20131203/72562_1 /TAXON_ID=36898 /ORGANISM="Pyramimonas sp., Strain CCMP2087" /LENGTH=186 /DNA_ID=CAMNT_0043896403 /DNA_START=177 /DNA_END=734 /DNA_ORIENTATION=+